MPIRDEDGHRAMQAAGKAWKAIKTSGAKTWREWTEVIGPGLVKARAEAQSISNASGKGYNAAMGALLEEYGFGNALERHRSQVTRADLLHCMDYLTEIEKWRHDAKASVLLPVADMAEVDATPLQPAAEEAEHEAVTEANVEAYTA
jgi:hypothetical protein